MATDILRRNQAPLSDEAWNEIDEQAREVFSSYLTARGLVDFDGPHGWNLGCVDLGTLDTNSKKTAKGVKWGLRKILPLMELRIPFQLNQMELDSISRGSKDPELAPLEDAVKKISLFEEDVIYNGFSGAGIEGILSGSSQKALSLPPSADDFPKVVTAAVAAQREAGVNGPYTLVLGPKPYQALMEAHKGGYPVRRIVQDIVGTEVQMSSVLTGGVLVSTKAGNFEMTVGQDLSIGYWKHDGDAVDFYITESFTFRVLEPAAAVELKVKK